MNTVKGPWIIDIFMQTNFKTFTTNETTFSIMKWVSQWLYKTSSDQINKVFSKIELYWIDYCKNYNSVSTILQIYINKLHSNQIMESFMFLSLILNLINNNYLFNYLTQLGGKFIALLYIYCQDFILQFIFYFFGFKNLLNK